MMRLRIFDLPARREQQSVMSRALSLSTLRCASNGAVSSMPRSMMAFCTALRNAFVFCLSSSSARARRCNSSAAASRITWLWTALVNVHASHQLVCAARKMTVDLVVLAVEVRLLRLRWRCLRLLLLLLASTLLLPDRLVILDVLWRLF